MVWKVRKIKKLSGLKFVDILYQPKVINIFVTRGHVAIHPSDNFEPIQGAIILGMNNWTYKEKCRTNWYQKLKK